MPEASNRERDLVLAPNEFALISDQTKGHIVVYVGPCKTSLANTDQPVVFNDRTKRFERCNLEQSISIFSTAPEGWYLNLKNPAKDNHQPRTYGPNNLPELNIGRKVNIPGPVSFSLWPGQMVRIIQGHHLRSNQYLVVRVYDEEAAKANWKKAVIKLQTPVNPDGTPSAGTAPSPTSSPADPKSGVVDPSSDVPELTMGKQLVIKGTDVSFYIPPTGIEVVRDAQDAYVREAITLERLEYCILLDEDGNKRYIQGPDVVFPRPTEAFVEKHGSRKFKAIELNEISGLYIKVIAPYKGTDGVDHKVGEELFITGKDQMIYFPRPEHAIIKYGEQEIHYAVAIPAGEGRYFLNRNTGRVTLKRGPCMFLPDPRQEVIVRRIIEPKQCSLWFPGNQEALEYNVHLKNIARAQHADTYLVDGEARAKLPPQAPAPGRPGLPALAAEAAADGHAGDDFTRKRGYTPPRTITLDTKYEGAVAIDIWTGYAVLVVGRAGERRVIAGPQTYLLEYDEALESLELSTGTPKSDESKIKTAYLRVLHNKVSDIVEAETNDLCRVRLKLSYRVNFEGDSSRWFNVENYVKFLTDHMRSLVRHSVKQHRIEEFYANAIRLVRDTILGSSGTDSKRTGRSFAENGMHIYDVEVLDVKIGDEAIEKLLIDAQHSVVKQTLEIASQKRHLEFTQQNETIKQQVGEAQSKTKQQEFELLTHEAKSQLSLNLAKIEAETESRKRTLEAKLSDQATLGKIDTAELSRKKETFDLELEVTRRRLALKLEELKTETEAVIGKAGAVSPKLIAAMQAFSDKALAERMAQSMAPLAILGGRSVADVFAQLLKGTVLEGVLKSEPGTE